MKYLLLKDKKKRNFFFKSERRINALKTLCSPALDLNIKPKFYNYSSLHVLGQFSSVIRIRNRCIVTGRSRSVYRFCKLNRMHFRDYAGRGDIPGIRFSTW